jgi:DNA polymerase (family 10)
MATKTYRTRAQVAGVVRKIEQRLPGARVCGSWRRGSERIGDVDVLVVTASGELPDLAALGDFVEWDSGAKKAGRGRVHLDDGLPPLQVDVYACGPISEGAFLWFLTGPKTVNIRMRAEAMSRGWKLSQYGLFDAYEVQVDDGTEASVAEWLGVEWVELLDPRSRDAFSAPSGPEVREVKVTGSKGDEYVVRVDGRRASCTCPGFRFRRACRHVARVMEEDGRRRKEVE